MHAIIEAENVKVFAKALADAKKAVGIRNSIPILNCVMIRTCPGGITVCATDMDLCVETNVPASRSEPGGLVCVDIETLVKLVGKAPKSLPVEIASEKGVLHVRIGAVTTDLITPPADDFPRFSAPEPDIRFELPAVDLRGLLSTVRHAISTEETRYYFNGAFLTAATRDGIFVLRAVATDGHRIALVEKPLPAGAGDLGPHDHGVIVPVRTIAALLSRLSRETNPVEITLSAKRDRIAFRTGGTLITSKLVDGTFPDYDRVIPLNNVNILRVRTAAFAGAVAQLASVGKQRFSRIVKLTLGGADALDLEARSDDGGTVSSRLNSGDVAYVGASPLEIGFQCRYVADILDQMGEIAEIRFGEPTGPATWHDPADPSRLFVLMPIRV